MSYRRHILMHKRKDGFYYLPIRGATISDESTLDSILLCGIQRYQLEIFCSYQIIQGGAILEDLELIQDTYEFFSDAIRGEQLEYARYDKYHNLEIYIRALGGIQIYINAVENIGPYEIWYFSGSNYPIVA